MSQALYHASTAKPLGGSQQRRVHSRRCVASVVASVSSPGESTAPVAQLPLSAVAQVKQCASAVSAALGDGIVLQRVELELPLIGATDLDDWPGGTRQQLVAAVPLVSQLLTELAGSSIPVARTSLDDSDGVALFTTSAHRVVTFVTADTLDQVKDLLQKDRGLCVFVNAAWKDSDFGWGPFVQRELKDFAGSLQETYSLRKMRIRGQQLRVVRAYPSAFTVYAMGLDGGKADEIMCTSPTRPTYADLELAINKLGKRSIANSDLLTRANAELDFNKRSANDF
jgi:Domain of unknown function (DUF1995)